MRRQCLHCGTIFESTYEAIHCPECVKKLREQYKWHGKVCISCGSPFIGGPRAMYCPDCRYLRQQQQHKEYRERKMRGASRTLGDTDICENCGKPYIIEGGLQRYCPECSKSIHMERQRESAIQYYADHVDPEQRQELRSEAVAPIHCVICNKLFVPYRSQKTCSDECQAILYARTKEPTPEQRKKYRENLRKKQEALSDEEKEALRLKTNKRKLNNYYVARQKENLLPTEEQERLRIERNQKSREWREAQKKKIAALPPDEKERLRLERNRKAREKYAARKQKQKEQQS